MPTHLFTAQNPHGAPIHFLPTLSNMIVHPPTASGHFPQAFKALVQQYATHFCSTLSTG